MRRHSAPLFWSIIAFLLRSLPSWSNVFTPGGVRLQLVDSWYHLRSIEFFALNFPHRLRHDPLAFFPGGAEPSWPPLFDSLIGTLAWLLAGGAPTSRGIEAVAALAPPFCGAGTVFVVYWVTVRLFESKTASLAACLTAVLPGPFFVRSSLGFSDHHAFEVLLATILLAAVLGSLDTGRPWKAGLALGLYLLAWNGASLAVAILGLWAAFMITVWADRTAAGRLTRTTLSTFGLATLAVLAFWSFLPQAGLALVSLAGCSSLVLVALLLGRARARGRPSAGARAGLLTLVATGAFGAVWVLAPGVWTESLGRLMPSGAELSVSEMRPLFLGLDGRFSLAPAWAALGPIFFLFLAAWLAFAVEAYRRASAERTLLLIWSGSLLALTLMQIRFAASLGPSCAVLVAWGAMRFVQAIKSSASSDSRLQGGSLALAWSVIVLLAIYPSTLMALRQGGQNRGPSDAWLEGLSWLREQTPSLAAPAQYGVLAWWDYGSLITYRARRAPMANGSGLGIRSVAEILTETDLQKAEEKVLASGARYVLVDAELILRMTHSSPRALEGKILGALQWAGRPQDEFVEIVDRLRDDGSTLATPLYFPRYFQSLATRLVLFGGEAVQPDTISLVQLVSRETVAKETVAKGAASGESMPGRPVGRRLLRQQISFRRADEAQSYLEARRQEGQTGWKIASLNPFQPPIPLDAVTKLRTVYSSSVSAETLPSLRIFEVVASD